MNSAAPIPDSETPLVELTDMFSFMTTDAMSSQACTWAFKSTSEMEDEPGSHRHVAEDIWTLGEQFTKRSDRAAAGELRQLCTEVHKLGHAYEVLDRLWLRSKNSSEHARVWLLIEHVFSGIPDASRTSAERQTVLTDPVLLGLFEELGTADARPPPPQREAGFIVRNAESDGDVTTDDDDAEAMEEVD